MGIGDGGVPQRVPVFGLGVSTLHRLPLLLQHLQAFVGHHHIQIALSGGQHQLLLLQVRLQPGCLSTPSQLLPLCVTFGVVQRLPRLHGPTPGGAMVDRGVEIHARGGGHGRCGELGTGHAGLQAHGASRGAGRHTGAPQRIGLLAQSLGCGAGGLRRSHLGVGLTSLLPDLNQIQGLGCTGLRHQPGQQSQTPGAHTGPSSADTLKCVMSIGAHVLVHLRACNPVSIQRNKSCAETAPDSRWISRAL